MWAQSKGYHPIKCLEDSGVGRGRAWHSSLKVFLKGPSSVRKKWNCLRQCWENFWEMGRSAYGLFWANRHHLELNWAELFAIHQTLYERPSQWIWSMDWETTFYYISLKLYSSLLYMFRQTKIFFFFKWHRNIPQSEVAKYQTGTYNSLGCEPLPRCEHTSLGREHTITTCTVWGGHIPQFGMGTYQIPEIWTHHKLGDKIQNAWNRKIYHSLGTYHSLGGTHHSLGWEHTTVLSGNIPNRNRPQFGMAKYQTGTYHSLWCKHTTV